MSRLSAFILQFSTLLLLSFSLNASELEYHGYYRAGVGTNDKGGDQTCFSGPGAPSNQFRLGNECSNYGELSLINKYKKGKNFFDTHLLLAFNQSGHTNWESANTGGQPIVVRELYFRGGNFSDSNLIFWAGKRFLREQDLYMNDWYYFADTSGNGGGVEGLNFFGGNLMISYLKETLSTETTIGKVATTHYDIRVKDIPLIKNQFLNLWIDYGYMPESFDSTTPTKLYASQNGYALGILHDLRLKNGFNHFSIVYGSGILNSLGLGGNSLAVKDSDDFKTRQKATTFRIVDHLTTTLSKKMKFHFMAAYEHKSTTLNNDTTSTDFYNIGIQPIYYFDDHYHLSGVIGHSLYATKNVEDQHFTRITIAPGLSINSSIWARPVLRLFHTKSIWSKSAKGSVGGSIYENETEGSNFGIQGEAWF